MPIKQKLASGPTWQLTLFAMSSAFLTYFCMYAFRKPFSAGHYEGLTFLGTQIELKTAFVIGQIFGYTLSKFIGIKVCSEAARTKRARLLIAMIVLAEIALFAFATLPTPLKVLAIFANGLPLGMIWGLVVSYLEGRRTSEIMLAGLSCSYIVASGVVKDIGRALMQAGMSEWWMPVATGAIFLPFFLLAVWLLEQIPHPTAADEAERVHREPMDARARMAFLQRFMLGLALLFVVYFFLTAYRDFRDNYGVELFAELGYGEAPAIFTRTELPVAFGVMLALAGINLVRNSRAGMLAALGVMTAGVLMIGAGTLLLDLNYIDGVTWMIVVGLGSYLTYVPFGSVLFDRIIAASGAVGTAVFAIMVADACGYIGSMGLQIYRDFAHHDVTRLAFFRGFSYLLAVFGAILLIACSIYFLQRCKRAPQPMTE